MRLIFPLNIRLNLCTSFGINKIEYTQKKIINGLCILGFHQIQLQVANYLVFLNNIQSQNQAQPLTRTQRTQTSLLLQNKILRGIAIVVIEQIYSTNVYEQPISDNAVLTKMIVQLVDIEVISVIKEKEEAKQEYEQGIQQGKTMEYCEQDENFPEIKMLNQDSWLLKVTFEYIQPSEVCFNQFWKVEISPMIDQTYLSLNPEIDYQQKLFKTIQNHVNLKGRELNFKQDCIIMTDTGSKIQFVQSPTHKLLYLNAKNIQDEQPKKLQMVLEDVPQNFTPFKQFTLLF